MNEELRIAGFPFHEWLRERYPEAFVQAVSTGACCDRSDRYDESYPMLDAFGNRITMVATLYMATKVYEDMAKINEDFRQAVAMENWDKAAKAMAESRKIFADRETKEMGRRAEGRQMKRERRRDQPWRKGHA